MVHVIMNDQQRPRHSTLCMHVKASNLGSRKAQAGLRVAQYRASKSALPVPLPEHHRLATGNAHAAANAALLTEA